MLRIRLTNAVRARSASFDGRKAAPARAVAGAGARAARISRLPSSQLADRVRFFAFFPADLRAKKRLIANQNDKAKMSSELPFKTLVIKWLNNRKCKECLVSTADKIIQRSDSKQKFEI